MTGGFSGKRRKTIRKFAEGARARDVDRIVSKVIAALETRSGHFEEPLLSEGSGLGGARLKRHSRSLPDRFRRRVEPHKSVEAIGFDPTIFDAAASFDAEVVGFARAAADLAEERRATVVALAEMSARGDRIDRVQSENRAALNHLLSC
ncbi:hypothetical protein [Methylosinus sporium]|uniref:Uncharacterized protein n=1 Tax=Methylosinus sporium TaxID=428 RepID=A0A2U1SLK5_METSR|nr:hypothetical protein [Methylosinus sporium]PWB92476.1 hypothetical protein C5689_18005 [Methylosinus sporium]